MSGPARPCRVVWARGWVLLALSGGCTLTPEGFYERWDEAAAVATERCGGPSVPDADVVGPWMGDVQCPAFDPGAARACLRATRAVRVVDCVDSEQRPGAWPMPASCAPQAVCGPAPTTTDSDLPGAAAG